MSGNKLGPAETANEEKMIKIDLINYQFSDLPDGAYLAAMAESGVSVEDFEAYSNWCARKRK